MMTNSSPQSEAVDVHLVGGPAYWAGHTLPVDRESLAGPLDAVGAYLLIGDGSHWDEGAVPVGEDWRAHYAPGEDGDDRTVWRFQGWIPW